jgi:hypothetical protein
MSEEERRKLIASQRSALYGEGPYVDETGTPHPGMPGPPRGPPSLRGVSPLAYEYGRTPPIHPQAGSQPPVEGSGMGPQTSNPSDPTRTNSTSSPAPNVPSQQQQQTASPGSSPSLGGAPNSKPSQGPAVAPIGTRPSGNSAQPTIKRSTPPVPSSLNQGYTTSEAESSGAASQSNPSSAAAEAPNNGLSGWGGRSGSVWGNNRSGQQASVWG